MDVITLKELLTKDIKGKVLFRIPYLAYPSVWFSNAIERGE